MKCFTAQQSSSRHTAGRNSTQRWSRTADPETTPRSPIADQSTGSNELFPRRRSQIETDE
jgi:hypothetical protein